MYLKRIETLGFKSFADKTVINFNEGVTGVVGPNGSGKSNVVDAVRWVLGEQSVKQLRGGATMTDVIFSGSKSRSAHSYAFVTLVLDNFDRFVNLDYNEIEITRKVYRNGESEYLLNGAKCRLKDINDLMMDTGLGKESFNIISQDKVQALLNSKAEERRYIFEEAAGVLKYRKRKESAERKLKSTSENLIRVSDILLELNKQIKPLEKQSIDAKKYLTISEELKGIEIALIAQEIYLLNEKFKSLNTNKSLINDSLVSKNNEEFKLEKQIENLNDNVLKIEKDLESNNLKFIELSDLINEAKIEKKVFDERRKYSNKKNKVDSNRSLLIERELEILTRIENEKLRLSAIENEKQKLESVYSNSDNNHSKLLQKRRNIRDDYANCDSKMILEKSKINDFEHNNKRYLFSGVSAVLNSNVLMGIIGIVSNVVSFDDMYAKAMDYAFSASNQYVICETKKDAKKAIEFLNKYKKGRATFMPLDNIHSSKNKFDFSSYNNIFGFADDFVTCDDKYKVVISSLIGNVVIAKDLDAANKFYKNCNKFRIITLTGEIINPRGSITGGENYNNKKGFFTARHEYESSKKELENLEEKLKELSQDDLSVNKEISNSEEKLYKLKIQVMQVNENYKIISQNLEDLNITINDINNELNSLSKLSNNQAEEEERRIVNLIKQYQEELSEISSFIDKNKFDKASIMVNLDETRDNYKALLIEIKKDQDQVNDINVSLGEINVKLDINLNTLNEVYELTFESAFENHQLNIDIDSARTKVKQLKLEIKPLEHCNLNAIEEYKIVKERFDFLTLQKNDILKAKNELEDIITELDNTMKTQFKSTFDEVSKQYSIMFKQLFGGGDAKLSLTDNRNLLTTGIEIIAQPPGKKLQHLTLLSGGEKALSTLVLLFAIIKVRPVPFCILDEVEAALDEANLSRFANFLEGFSNYIQFIIITHRKVTMKNADVLYGVTMQESGVSKFVSVRLNEASEMIGGAK
ncbi:MAG: AAA family ATPase [Bacilli bacterium]